MSPAPAATLASATTSVSRLPQAREAFTRVLNLRTVAMVFYFCVVVVAGRKLMELQFEATEPWLWSTVRFLRQNLVSGLVLLLTMACADAAAVAWRLARRQSLMLGVGLVAAGAALSVVLRVWLAGTSTRAAADSGYLLGVWLTWAMFGAMAYTLFCLAREDDQQRRRLREAERAQQQLGARMLQARLSALQAQIEPHFLFNTLANVRRLYETTPSRGREMLACLIDYLRAALPSMRSADSTLKRELELARSFLTILQMRMGDRLQFSIGAGSDLLEAQMPPMVLPTLVENAVKHGLGPLPEGGRIDIQAWRSGEQLVVEVRDSGAGLSGSGGSGVGLANTRSRLSGLYGSGASLQLASATPRGVVATLRLPFNVSAPVPVQAWA
jgi:signal transduction histidine kinase